MKSNNRADQWNADDFLVSSRIFQIAAVRPGTANNAEYDIDFTNGEGKCWRPPVTVCKILRGAWHTEKGQEAAWVGRRVELFRDDTVKFGNEISPGVRVSRISHIDKPWSRKLLASQGKKELHTVQPLPDVDPAITTHLDAIQQATTLDDLKAAFFAAPAAVQKTPQFIAAKDAKKAELTPTSEQGQA